MKKLLRNLNENQANDIQYYDKRKKANSENATKKDVFLMGQILIDKFKTMTTATRRRQ